MVYLIEAKRTALGKYAGVFSQISATGLATQLLTSLLNKYPLIKKRVDQVIIGNVLSAGLGQNPARIVTIKSGLSYKVPAFTINKVCGSGLKSIILGTQSILLKESEIVVAGGMENMSRCPYYLDNFRFGARLGPQIVRDGLLADGLNCSLIDKHMGITAENIARKYQISRKSQDEYAWQSHQKAIYATDHKLFKNEIVPINIVTKKQDRLIDSDEQPRRDTTLNKLAELPSVFMRNGTVTAGNSSSINDGASLVILASEKAVKKFDLKPTAVIKAYASIGCNPQYMGLGSYYSTLACLKKAKLKVTDIDLWEINEAFASQTLAVLKLLKLNPKKVNLYGGAIALGHPIGASGARLITTLFHQLKTKDFRYAMASLCIGGGQGISMIIEKI